MDEKERAILELQRKVDRIQKVTDKVSPMEERLNNLERQAISSKEILTSQETAVYIGVSLSQLYKMTSTHSIPQRA